MPDCPLCKKDDRVQRVMSIVAEGTTRSDESTRYAGWSRQVDWTGSLDWTSGPIDMVSASTTFSQTVQARRLSLETPPAPKLDYFGYGYVLSGLFFGAFVAISTSTGLAGGIAFALALMGVGWLGVQWRNGRKLKPYRARLEWLLPRWNIWTELYHCARCDGVFVPGSPLPPAPTELMRAYIEAELQLREGRPASRPDTDAPAPYPPNNTPPINTPGSPTGSGALVLIDAGSIPGDVVDTLRAELGLTTEQARAQIAHVPVRLGAGLSLAQAKRLQHKLEQAGASVRLE